MTDKPTDIELDKTIAMLKNNIVDPYVMVIPGSDKWLRLSDVLKEVRELRKQVASSNRAVQDAYNAYADEFEKNKKLREENETLKRQVESHRGVLNKIYSTPLYLFEAYNLVSKELTKEKF